MNNKRLREHLKKLLRSWRYKLAVINRYRNRDLDAEALECMNEINKLKTRLKKLNEELGDGDN